MKNTVFHFAFFVLLRESVHSVTIKKSQNTICDPVDDQVLNQVLGSAYNARYMSTDKPEDDDANDNEDERNKRKSNGPRSFYVDESYNKEIEVEEPKWPWDKLAIKRKKRALQQWQCETKIKWIDLGVDYYPRYLRSVECSRSSCWFGRYKCKPKSFAIKLLRRKRDRCIVAKFGSSLGMEGLPQELRELWVWEERAVNFCCDCSL